MTNASMPTFLTKFVALSARYSLRARLIVFAASGLAALLIGVGLQALATNSLENAIRLREHALEMDANVFKRQAAAQGYLRTYDSSLITFYPFGNFNNSIYYHADTRFVKRYGTNW